MSKRAALCNGDVCEILDSNKVPFTYDMHHLSYQFAARLAVGEKDSIDQYLGFNGKREGGALSFSAKTATTVVAPTLRSEHPAKISMISLIPASIRSCQGAAAVKVRWDAHVQRGVSQVTEIWVRDVNGKEKLFVSGHNSGEETTGSWARPGLLFTLKDASNGAVLDSVELEGQACVRS
ncbi:hypothetical protein D3C76_1208110 [compost metagenome]